MKGLTVCLVGFFLTGMIQLGCVPLADEEFRDAFPDQADLKIVLGETDQGEDAKKSAFDCPECCVDDETGDYVDAETYVMTRGATYHVNGTLVAVYIWFDYVINEPYSEEIEDGFIWGPWDDTDIDPLSRLAYRVVMTKNSDESFDYALEIKLINDGEDAWVPYAYGNLSPTEEPHKGAGTLTIDFDLLHELDSSHPSQYHGLISYDFDVRQTAPTEENPNTVVTTFIDFWEEAGFGQEDSVPMNSEYLYERYDQLSGKLEFEAEVDITGPDDAPDGVDETFNVVSRWNSVGKGIGTASITGGSLPEMNVDSYLLTECWADSSYYYFENYDYENVTFTDGTDPIDQLNCGDEANCPVF